MNSSLGGSFSNLKFVNNNTNLASPSVNLTNNANVTTAFNFGNLGYSKLINNGNITSGINDNLNLVSNNSCLTTKFDLVNNGFILMEILK